MFLFLEAVWVWRNPVYTTFCHWALLSHPRARHSVGSSPAFPCAPAHHPAKSSICRPRRPCTTHTAVLQSRKAVTPPQHLQLLIVICKHEL